MHSHNDSIQPRPGIFMDMDITAIGSQDRFPLGCVGKKIVMAPQLLIIFPDGKIAFPAHSYIGSHVICTVVNAGNREFLCPFISPYHYSVPDCYLQIGRRRLRKYHLILIPAGLPHTDMETFRFRNHIGCIIRSVYRYVRHSQEIAVCYFRIRSDHFLSLCRSKLSHHLHADIQIRRIKGIHHAFSIRPEPDIHSPGQ